MAGRHVLIDGYNVIRVDPVLSRLELTSMEEARAALVRTVASWPRFAGDQVTIVFDGRGTRSFASATRQGHVTVTFPPPGQSADDYIKALARTARDPENTVVVTNDSDIRNFCSGLGCVVTSSQNLLVQLTSPHKARRPKPDFEPDQANTANDTSKKGNPRKLPKRLRGRHDVRF